jgi:hypothetical protein
MQEILEEEKTKLEDLMHHLKDYMNTSFEIVKMKAVEKGVAIAATYIIALLFLNVALALYIGTKLNNSFYGFLIVGGFYLLMAIILSAGKKSIIETPVSNALIKQIFKEDKE